LWDGDSERLGSLFIHNQRESRRLPNPQFGGVRASRNLIYTPRKASVLLRNRRALIRNDPVHQRFPPAKAVMSKPASGSING
jgi:hypothetical protein